MINSLQSANTSPQESIIKKAILTRALEEHLLHLFHAGKIHGTVHTCIGQEFVAATLSENLRTSDSIFSNHRGHGHFLSSVGNTTGLLAEILGSSDGICGGRGGSQHLHQGNFYSNGIQGGMTAIAVGSALTKKLTNSQAIAVVYLGDGTFGEGIVYEAMNLGSKLAVPILFVIEDNGIAQTTLTEWSLAGSFADRAKAFDIQYFNGSTDAWELLAETSNRAVEFVRVHCKPAVFHIKTARLKAHSKGDDTRDTQQVKQLCQNDPLQKLLQEPQWSQRYEALKVELNKITDEILKKESEAGPAARQSLKAEVEQLQWKKESVDQTNYGTSLNEAIKAWMTSDHRAVFIGEDVLSPYGGAFKIADGLSELFPKRVFSTPISEAAIVGLATGMALEQWTPAVEIMFGDFIGLAFDQLLNHAAKFQEMFGLKTGFKMMVRTPMGGYRGYGPTHSQSLEKHLLGIPGLKVIAANGFVPPSKIFESFQKDSGVVVFCENKKLYSNPIALPVAGFEVLHSNELYPSCWIRPRASQVSVTIITYGGMAGVCAEVAERLFAEHDVLCQVVVFSQLYPLELQAYTALLATSRYFLTVEEGQGFAGFGAEIASQVAEMKNGQSFKLARCYPEARIIPSSFTDEQLMLPGADKIISKALEILDV